MTYRIGVTGSSEWKNKTQIKEILFKLKKQFGDEDFSIISLGANKGVDFLVKKY